MSKQNALIASAQVLTGQRIDDPTRQKRSWQDSAWEFYDEAGPLRYGTKWVSDLISKARLFAARLSDTGDEPIPIETGPAAEAIEALAGGTGGQTRLLRSLAVQLTVPGIGYLVGTDDGATWAVYSADTIRLKTPAAPGSLPIYEVQTNESSWEELPPESIVVKIWRPHERFHWEPDSPARAALSDLQELRRVDQYIEATLVSRLAGAGVVVIPSEASWPTAPDEPDGKHPFVSEILEVMMTAVKRPGTAAQVVPIPVEIPAEYADAFQHITFEAELSDKILGMRESALRMISISLDIPAEILTGMGDVNHWGQWQIEESAVKVHAEPLLETITDALTSGYLRPVLEAQGEDADDIVVWADTSELTTRPDRSEDSIALYDRGLVNEEAARRETGMGEDDALTDEEVGMWAYKKILQQGTNSQLISLALQGLGIDVPSVANVMLTGAPVSSNGDGGDNVEEEDVEDRSGADQETMPDTRDEPPPEFDTSLLVLEAYVNRALEVARNRIGGRSKTAPFDGAWDKLRPILCELGLDPIVTTERLESYCRTLLDQRLEYDRESFKVVINGLRYSLEVAA